MDILSRKFLSNINRPRTFTGAVQPVKDIVRRLTGFFEFTKADDVTAGVFVGGEGREELMGSETIDAPNGPSTF